MRDIFLAMDEPTTYPERAPDSMPPLRLSDEEFSRAMESFTIVGTDVLFINRERRSVYLAKRKALPLLGYWMIGGRMLAGEDPRTSMRRVAKRETGLELVADRFSFVKLNRYLWKTRAQDPHEKGSDNLCYTFIAELTPEEIALAAANLDRQEYDVSAGLTEFDATSLAQAKGIHQAIRDLYAHVFPDVDI